MKREIKFKAKRVNGNKWAYGSYYYSLDEGDIIMSNHHYSGDGRAKPPFDYDFKIRVIPETVCQFTGLKDKDGVDIYEGDIVRSGTVGEVFYENGGFMYKYDHPEDPETIPLGDLNISEVIGNIHDNK